MRYKAIYFILFFTITFALLSCDDNGNPEKKNKIKLTGIQILKDNIAISDFEVIDSLLVVLNRPGFSSLFEVYNINQNFKSILDFGKTGTGPNEFENTIRLNHHIFKHNSQYFFYVYEINKNLLSLINLSKTLKSRDIVISKTFKINPKTNFDNLFVLDSLLIVGNSNNLDLKMKRLKYYNPILDTIIKNVELFPIIEKRQKKLSFIQNHYNRLFINILRLNPDKTKIVSAMPFLDRIDVFNATSGNKTVTINHKNIDYKTIINQKERKVFWGDIYCLDKYFYALNYKNGIFEKELYNGNFSETHLIKFSWNGDEMERFLINEPIYKFIIDQKRNAIYAISLNDKIVKYEFEEKE